jgi:hypothetical protein
MAVVEWGHGRREEVVHPDEADELIDRVAAEAREAGKPQDVKAPLEGAGTLGIVVGAEWSALNHIPPDLDPPYKASV